MSIDPQVDIDTHQNGVFFCREKLPRAKLVSATIYDDEFYLIWKVSILRKGITTGDNVTSSRR